MHNDNNKNNRSKRKNKPFFSNKITHILVWGGANIVNEARILSMHR